MLDGFKVASLLFAVAVWGRCIVAEWRCVVEPFQISAFLPDCHCPKELDVARVGMD